MRRIATREAVAGLAAVAMTLSGSLLPARVMAATTTCAFDGSHCYGATFSGSGSTDVGTRYTTTTPSSWSVNLAANSTTDEGAWISDVNNPNNAVEAGYYSGYWPYPNYGYTNSLVPYYMPTDGSGTNWNSPIPASTSLDVQLISSGGGTYVSFYYADGGPSAGNSYVVSSPRQNYAQGEVTNSTKTWMGGGSGETFTMYWTTDTSGSAWYTWGSNTVCSNSPY